MIRTHVLRVAVMGLLVLGACGGHPVADVGPAEPSAAAHTVTVTTEIVPGRHGEMFIEGAVPEIRLVAGDGTTIEPVRDHVGTPVFERLAAGRYVLRAVLRPCDGNCGYLDRPTGPCRTVLHVPADRTARVTWRVGEDCRAR